MIAEHFPLRPFAAMARLGLGFLSVALISFPCAASTNHPPAGPGITYEHNEVPDVPWSIHMVKVDRSRNNLQFDTTLGAGQQLGMGLVSEQLKSVPHEVGRVLAAINGDFYNFENKDYAGDPKGLQIIRGELVSAPDEGRSCFWIDATGNPRITNIQSRFSVTLPSGRSAPIGLNEERKDGMMVLFTKAFGTSTHTSGGTEIIIKRGTSTNWLPLAIGKTYLGAVQEIRTGGNSPITADTIVLSVDSSVVAQVNGMKAGDAIRVSTATVPDIEGTPMAIGGGPALIHGKKIANFKGFLQRRDPRTALGWNKTHFFLVVIDGRQKNSVGMTFPELATYMLSLGCDEAINLDGGGSATLWVYGHVMNSPSEGHERPAANALVVVRKESAP
jgi:exopolysaccharide biosynthesis protein